VRHVILNTNMLPYGDLPPGTLWCFSAVSDTVWIKLRSADISGGDEHEHFDLGIAHRDDMRPNWQLMSGEAENIHVCQVVLVELPDDWKIKLVEAIKCVRAISGWSLKESKEAVVAYRDAGEEWTC
jgi:hypothetical protein